MWPGYEGEGYEGGGECGLGMRGRGVWPGYETRLKLMKSY